MSSQPQENQLMQDNLERDVQRPMRVWSKPYDLPGGDAVYFGVSPANSDEEHILVPFNGLAQMSFKNQWNPQGVPVDKVAIKYQGRTSEKIFDVMNDMLETVYQEIKENPPTSELAQKLASSLLEQDKYPRKDNTITAKFKVKDGVVLTTLVGIADFEAFKKRAMTFLGKKKPVPVGGVFHVQGVVLSNRGLDVCVKLWEISVRK